MDTTNEQAQHTAQQGEATPGLSKYDQRRTAGPWTYDEDSRWPGCIMGYEQPSSPAWVSRVGEVRCMSKADGDHLCACVNAFDGLTTAQVDALGAGGVLELVEALRAVCVNGAKAYAATREMHKTGREYSLLALAEVFPAGGLKDLEALLARPDGVGK